MFLPSLCILTFIFFEIMFFVYNFYKGREILWNGKTTFLKSYIFDEEYMGASLFVFDILSERYDIMVQNAVGVSFFMYLCKDSKAAGGIRYSNDGIFCFAACFAFL